MGKKKASVVVLGASKAGKTTLICYLETGEPVLEDPRTTLGIDIRETPINISGWSLSAIDVGGQELYRKSLWGLGVSQADGVIYVIDGTVKPKTDSKVFEESKFSFDYMLELVDHKIPLLILINKQDLTESEPLAVEEAISLYGISELKGRSFNILPCSAKFGEGIQDAVEWLLEKISKK
ncbi:MAG: GTP-binding protein [Candidatus Heimdallarchaeota archaeon]|nr:GTP-binding protein [Candidatus Heimdallarchaeota archaeon]